MWSRLSRPRTPPAANRPWSFLYQLHHCCCVDIRDKFESAMQRHRTQTVAVALTLPLIFGILVVSTTATVDFSSSVNSNLADGWQTAEQFNLNNINGYIGAFGDFNSDKYTDLFAVIENGTAVQVYQWDNAKKTFQPGAILSLEADARIATIAPGDFDYNGDLDLMVGYSLPNDTNGTVRLRIYPGDHDNFEPSKMVELPPSFGHPTVLDANNDLHLDLFGTFNGSRTFWVLSMQSHPVYEMRYPSAGQPLWSLAQPHSSALVDFNGDCLADLFVVSVECTAEQVQQATCPDTAPKQFEIWLNGNDGFSLSGTQRAPLGAGQVSFADFNGDGTMDMLFPVCYPPDSCAVNNSLQVVFNQQKPMCSVLGTQSGCRKSTALCASDSNWMLQLEPNNAVSSSRAVIVPTEAFGGRRFQPGSAGMPLTIRVGDYNLDGFPDLLIPTVWQRPDGSQAYTIELWQNVQCSDSTCGSSAASSGARTFQQMTDGTDALSSMLDAYAGAFFDIDDDGTLDIIVLRDSSLAQLASGSGRQYVSPVVNGYEMDAFFMKTLGSNGVCPINCDPPLKSFPDPKPYGVNLPGAVWKYTISDWSGTKHVVQGVQLQQSAYLALQTPYLLFGLGRTSNYLEELYMGVTTKGTHFHLWSGIIPNAQVIAFPYEPDKPDDWYLELWVKTSGLLMWVIVGVAVCLVLSGAAVLFFRWREKRQDVLEKQETAHLYHFDGF
eukprot:TRINITY_DN10777_c0_g1_i1.p1 TRINITY_DN10777_c0_g1~~TRINITY_DN10777_c0_g1_i1.p1  ORF type:complete len:720 (-),score=218.54 TRINITY_DN10777_c0_g1_i1:42-2201(-)